MKARVLGRAIIKEEFVALTGNAVEAVILAQFEYWEKRAYDFDQFLEEEFERLNEDRKSIDDDWKALMTHGWIYKSAEELSKEIMLSISPRSILRYTNALVEKGYLLRRHNPSHKWDRTFQYRLNFKRIHDELSTLGYELQEWKLQYEDMTNAFDNLSNRSDKLANGSDRVSNRSDTVSEQYQRILPENTTENTSKNISSREIDTDRTQSILFPDSLGNKEYKQPKGINTCESERFIPTGVCGPEGKKEPVDNKKKLSDNPSIRLIFDSWNNKGIPVCHKTLTDRMKSAITARLKDSYITEDICKAIENYAAAVKSEEHFWSYSGWDLTTFLNPGNLDRFMEANKPLEVFKKTSAREKEKPGGDSSSRYGFVDLADLTDDPAAEPDKTPVWCIANDDIREAFYAWKEGRYGGGK